MNWSDIPLRPPSRTLRQFAGLWMVFLGGIAGIQGIRHGWATLPVALAVLAGTLGPLGLCWPRLIRPVYVGAMILTFPLGWVISRLLLAVLFFGVFTPLGLIFRLLGRDALSLRVQPERDSYWTPRPVVTDVKRYFRQF